MTSEILYTPSDAEIQMIVDKVNKLMNEVTLRKLALMLKMIDSQKMYYAQVQA